MANIKFVIVSYRQHHGGPIVLHVLCKQLERLGYDSSIFYYACGNYRKGHRLMFWFNTLIFYIKDIIKEVFVKILGENKLITVPMFNGHVNIAVKGCKRHFFPFVDKDTIVVYPEDVYGNFLHAHKVVRYFLFYPNYMDGDYGERDMFICYRPEFNDAKLNPEVLTLRCPYYNVELYKRYNYKKRNGKCYIIRKGKGRLDLPNYFDGTVIDTLSEVDKVKVFNDSEYCISYDTESAYSSIAALCGCVSIVIPENGRDASYYRKEDPMHGIAYGWSDSELEFAIQTRDKVKEEYLNRNRESEEEVRKFIEICLNYFNNTK